ncbi:MAG: mobile mystery protein B [Coriobacteriales bacterium]|jgi:Fic-DOC domain mobile mystery protein B|nr:mobile mystery protein B [Coriobacteriales bacterium]
MIEQFTTPYGATPLTDEDIEGLIPNYVTTRGDLNLIEAENILKAKILFNNHPQRYMDVEYLLQEHVVREVHRAMYSDVWAWAGHYRTRLTNIGVYPEQIRERVLNLLLNAAEQFKGSQNSQTELDESVVRFHWDMVRIHPFKNGNGRHARQMADQLIRALGYPVFTWGSISIIEDNTARRTYIEALRKADQTLGDVADLIAFARS